MVTRLSVGNSPIPWGNKGSASYVEEPHVSYVTAQPLFLCHWITTFVEATADQCYADLIIYV